MQRINLGKTVPKLYRLIADLDRGVNAKILAAGMDEGFAHLLRLRAS